MNKIETLNIHQRSETLRSASAKDIATALGPTLHLDQTLSEWIYRYWLKAGNGGAVYSASEVYRTPWNSHIAHMVQRSDKHEFPVELHLLYSAYAASRYEELLLPCLPGYLAVQLQGLDRDQPSSLETFVTAAYLHDIEKVFEPRREYDQDHPWFKSPDDKKINKQNVLGENDFRCLGLPLGTEGERLKMGIVKWIIGRSSAPGDNSKMGELFNVVGGGVDRDLVLKILKVYCLVDGAIIRIANGEQQDTILDLASIALRGMQVGERESAFGVLLMMADNYAQGEPLMPEARKVFAPEQKRNLEICTKFVEDILI